MKIDNDQDKIQIQNFYRDSLKLGTFNNGLLSSLFLFTIIVIISVSIGYVFGSIFRFPFSQIFDQTKNNVAKIDVFSDEEINKLINSDTYNFEFYRQIIANLKTKYVDPSKIDDKKLFESSLKGLVSGIGDPNTVYMTNEDYKLYQSNMSGNFEGIGVKLTYENKKIVVDEVFENSPASKADVKRGFIFLEVNGENVENMTIEEVVNKVRGPKGTTVSILFFDPQTKTNQKRDIVRDQVYVKSIELKEKDQQTVILKIIRFSDKSFEEWKNNWDEVISKLDNSKYKNIIIDLRGNGGGYLAAAIHAASDFLDKDDLILIKRNREGGDNQIKNTRTPRLKDKNVVILVNGGTASASEILAGALRYNNGYKIVGSKSYGKGTVQQTFVLPNGGALKITVEYWLLPNGVVLDHENPINPDIEVNFNEESFRNGKDEQLEKALELFK